VARWCKASQLGKEKKGRERSGWMRAKNGWDECMESVLTVPVLVQVKYHYEKNLLTRYGTGWTITVYGGDLLAPLGWRRTL